jgi:lipopolysaccharide/colanic/teichoic acid biosynthesis glycosyltransferase
MESEHARHDISGGASARHEAPIPELNGPMGDQTRYITRPSSVSLAIQRAAKRLLDIGVASSALVILSPLFAAIALAIKITSPGPVFYRWPVVGQGGRPIPAYKFRSMVVGADAMKQQLLEHNEAIGPMFKMRHDPRVTSVGRFLRMFSLDELPQLWSVLRGDMSLVGPRPPLQTEYAQFTEWQKQKLSAKPGITCLWQISGRSEIRNFDEWVQLDLEYIRRWSIWLDLQILLRTIPVVLRGRGAW